MHSLGPAGIPVPVTVGLCTDEAVNERPFYVMEFVEGHILRSAPEAEAAFDEATRRARRRPHGRHARRAARRRPRRRRARRPGPARGVHRAPAQALARAVRPDAGRGRRPRRPRRAGERRAGPAHPEQQRTSVVHGDYRMDNVVLADDGTVRAILDWEICTLGDPLADLGLLMVYWADPTDAMAVLGLSPTTAPGFSTGPRSWSATPRSSDLDVSSIGYYVAFGYWKLACILQGVYARYVAGAGAGDQGSVDGFPVQIGRLFEMAAEALETAP